MKPRLEKWRPRGLHETPGLTGDDLEALGHSLPAEPTGAGKRAFAKRLSWIAAQYRLEDAWRDAPPPSDVRKKLEGILNAARRLTVQLNAGAKPDVDVDPLDFLPFTIRLPLVSAAERYGESAGGYDDHPPTPWQMRGQPEQYMDYHGDSKLAAAIEHVQLLVAWCERAIQATRQQEESAEIERIKRHGSAGRQARNTGNEPLNDMIARLGSLYQSVTGRPPGIARPRGARRRPGGPFVRFVLAVCERMQIPLTPAALEKRWRTVKPLVRAANRIENTIDRLDAGDDVVGRQKQEQRPREVRRQARRR